MNRIIQNISYLFNPPKPLARGLYKATSNIAQESNPEKLFLRVEEDGSGVLILNASTILHLNPVATEIAYGLINAHSENEIIDNILKKYNVEKNRAMQDYREIIEKINAIRNTTDLDPHEFFGIDRVPPHLSSNLSSPYRMDCAITYRLPSETDLLFAPVSRVKRELTTEEWFEIFDKSWQAGIPHIVLTGGEPTLRDDLPSLISHIEANGQICGLITDGIRLNDKNFLTSLLNSGLDYITILLDSDKNESWSAVQSISLEDIFTNVHMTITEQVIPSLEEVINKISSLKANAISISSIDTIEPAILRQAQDHAVTLGLRLVWDLPVPYSSYNPINLDLLSEEMALGSAHTWIYIEPDGDILPTQGIDIVLGNMLKDDWSKIWENCISYAQEHTH